MSNGNKIEIVKVWPKLDHEKYSLDLKLMVNGKPSEFAIRIKDDGSIVVLTDITLNRISIDSFGYPSD